MKRPFGSPSARVRVKHQDVWSIINEAAASSNIQPVTNMGQGFFGYNPPQFILDAAKDAIDRVDCNQYAPTKGRLRLRNAIADTFSSQFGRKLDPQSEIVITTGANEGMLSAFMAFLEPGDEVIVFEPFFDQYIHNIEMAGGQVIYVPLSPPQHVPDRKTSSSDWAYDAAQLRAAFSEKTRMLVLNNPQNPTGKVFSRAELEEIGNLCEQNDVIVLSDEVYDSLSYTDFTHFASLSPRLARRTLTVGSAGKCFYCTGWRVGWLIGPSELVQHVSTAHTRICFSTVSPFQEAVAIGLEKANKLGFWERSKELMRGKIDYFNQIWIELGLKFSSPQGGYFVLVNFSRVHLPKNYPLPEHVSTRRRDFHLAWFLIKDLGVAAIPASEFFTDDNAAGVGDWLRFAVCKEDDVLDEAMSRLRSLKMYISDGDD
ncbi:hypothetical protein KVT40_007257 [Elsinoe batatas]|uniref:Aminotransferase class I/classII large domain-containing protein n=1 Tax=Elsinoe batatas TaxID=2601811 RepID=A0A8K0L0Q9_9PEZI|nr:hypothetical protein KVT40_007257 [Elsinoe batatas]